MNPLINKKYKIIFKRIIAKKIIKFILDNYISQ